PCSPTCFTAADRSASACSLINRVIPTGPARLPGTPPGTEPPKNWARNWSNGLGPGSPKKPDIYSLLLTVGGFCPAGLPAEPTCQPARRDVRRCPRAPRSAVGVLRTVGTRRGRRSRVHTTGTQRGPAELAGVDTAHALERGTEPERIGIAHRMGDVGD